MKSFFVRVEPSGFINYGRFLDEALYLSRQNEELAFTVHYPADLEPTQERSFRNAVGVPDLSHPSIINKEAIESGLGHFTDAEWIRVESKGTSYLINLAKVSFYSSSSDTIQTSITVVVPAKELPPSPPGNVQLPNLPTKRTETKTEQGQTYTRFEFVKDRRRFLKVTPAVDPEELLASQTMEMYAVRNALEPESSEASLVDEPARKRFKLGRGK